MLRLVTIIITLTTLVVASFGQQGQQPDLNTWREQAQRNQQIHLPENAGPKHRTSERAPATEGSSPTNSYSPGDTPLFLVESQEVAKKGSIVPFYLLGNHLYSGYESRVYVSLVVLQAGEQGQYDGSVPAQYPQVSFGQYGSSLEKVYQYGAIKAYEHRFNAGDKPGRYWFSFLIWDTQGTLIQQVSSEVYLEDTGAGAGYPFIEEARLSGSAMYLKGNLFGNFYVAVGSGVNNFYSVAKASFGYGNKDGWVSSPGFGLPRATWMPVTVFQPETRTCVTYAPGLLYPKTY